MRPATRDGDGGSDAALPVAAKAAASEDWIRCYKKTALSRQMSDLRGFIDPSFQNFGH